MAVSHNYYQPSHVTNPEGRGLRPMADLVMSNIRTGPPVGEITTGSGPGEMQYDVPITSADIE